MDAQTYWQVLKIVYVGFYVISVTCAYLLGRGEAEDAANAFIDAWKSKLTHHNNGGKDNG